MTGIVSCGAYIPIYRMGQELLAGVWGGAAGRGEKAIANSDEDSITMAVEAAIDCLGDIDRQSIDGLYFASTTPPYREKQSASIIAVACDLRRDIFTADFTDSVRAGASALRAALDAVAAGSAKRVLVVASDCRLGAPGWRAQSQQKSHHHPGHGTPRDSRSMHSAPEEGAGGDPAPTGFLWPYLGESSGGRSDRSDPTGQHHGGEQRDRDNPAHR